MIESFDDFPSVFESRKRLYIVSYLNKGDRTYKELRRYMQITDGNLAGHMKKLINEGYVSQTKEFVNNRPQTTYHLTDYGRQQFADFKEFVRNILPITKKRIEEVEAEMAAKEAERAKKREARLQLERERAERRALRESLKKSKLNK